MTNPEDVLFSPSVKAEQERLGSRASFAIKEFATEITDNLRQFLDAIDTFFLLFLTSPTERGVVQ